MLLLVNCDVYSQTKKIAEERQAWFAYQNQLRFNSKWGLHSEIHLRTKENFFDNFSASVIRTGLSYYPNNHWRLTAGFAQLNQFQTGSRKKIAIYEYRPWQQVQRIDSFRKFILTQYLRLEQRFFQSNADNVSPVGHSSFGFRTRFNLTGSLLLSRKSSSHGSVSLNFSEEFFVNSENHFTHFFYDQNRIFLGLQYQFLRNTSLQAGYMNQFLKKSNSPEFRNIHIFRLYLLQNFHFK
jgi:hypothetical protein